VTLQAPAHLVLLPSPVRADLVRWARDGYPNEACGLVVGLQEHGCTRVRRAVQARNLVVERARDRFELDPGDQLAADRAAQGEGLAVVGVWHSHPDHPAVPSETDRAAAWESWSYLILSVGAEGVGALRSWRLSAGAFQEEEVSTMSHAVIRIPTPLRDYTRGRDEVEVECTTVSEALRELGERAPGILERVLDPGGKLRPFVNVFVGPDDVRRLQGLESAVPDRSVISIVPAVAGGAVEGGKGAR